jgi:hypothetical protein
LLVSEIAPDATVALQAGPPSVDTPDEATPLLVEVEPVLPEVVPLEVVPELVPLEPELAVPPPPELPDVVEPLLVPLLVATLLLVPEEDVLPVEPSSTDDPLEPWPCPLPAEPESSAEPPPPNPALVFADPQATARTTRATPRASPRGCLGIRMSGWTQTAHAEAQQRMSVA